MGVGFETFGVYRGLSEQVLESAQFLDLAVMCLTRTIAGDRRDAKQIDGKPDGKTVSLNRRRNFAVS